MSEPSSLYNGDKIKFHFVEYFPERDLDATAAPVDRVFFCARVVEKNGQPIAPVVTEFGVYTYNLPPVRELMYHGDNFYDVRRNKTCLEATIGLGYGRVKKNGEPCDVMLFIDTKSIRDTGETAPSMINDREPERIGFGRMLPSPGLMLEQK